MLPFLQDQSNLNSMYCKKIKLNGVNPTAVNFSGSDTKAYLLGSVAETFDLSTNGLTFIVAIDGGSTETATFNCAAGYETGGTTPSTDITALTSPTFKIAINGDATPQSVTLAVTGNDTGAKIATEMQTKIRALTGVYATVTVAYSTDHYVITSGTKGTGSSVRVTAGASNDVSAALKIGAVNGATDTDGTGDFVNSAVATATEVLAVLSTDITKATCTASAGKIRVESKSVGYSSSVVLGSGTANTVLGFTNSQSAGGEQALGFGRNMSDDDYFVSVTLNGASTVSARGISANTRTSTGFEISCETTSATDYVDVIVVGNSTK